MCKYAVHSVTLWSSDKKKSAFQQIGAAYSSSVFSLMPTIDYLTTLKKSDYCTKTGHKTGRKTGCKEDIKQYAKLKQEEEEKNTPLYSH